MLHALGKFLKQLEQWEKYQSSSFWLVTIGLYSFFSAAFGALFPESPESPSHSHLVVEQVRGGGRKDGPFLGKRKKFDFKFHRRLEQHFPDWPERMDYQKKQTEFYRSALRKQKERRRVGALDDPKFYTKEELDALDYVNGKGVYAKYQDKKEKYNIFDTRQSFLLKMHDEQLRNDFLNSFNKKNF